VREHARRVRRQVAAALQWNSDRRARIVQAETDLVAAAHSLTSEQARE
jgi:hypothetical protein